MYIIIMIYVRKPELNKIKTKKQITRLKCKIIKMQKKAKEAKNWASYNRIIKFKDKLIEDLQRLENERG
ncbi:hypothetical protein [Tortoise microvirus 20]|nr:hypothetical protein [Tortoise microvirus 20]